MGFRTLPRAACVMAALGAVAAAPSGVSSEPIISCPPASIQATVEERGQVCFDLPVVGADSVSADFGNWSNGRICFTATRQGTWQIPVTAWGDGMAVKCQISVEVSFAGTPSMVSAESAPDPDQPTIE